ncbi:Hypp4730 [Branchiostoma lanceolatum]|uniref:Hypp4730 protein n=1 Tax=Branchiostoma lanceolatum TaxID=7740 RepID=A0A8K0ADF5_BRALA|nr:Hypp4730 [Branchiostoma lanceolatum]
MVMIIAASLACCRNVCSVRRRQDLPLHQGNQVVTSDAVNGRTSNDNSPCNDPGEPHEYAEIDDEDNDDTISPYALFIIVFAIYGKSGASDGTTDSAEQNCVISISGNSDGKRRAVCNVSTEADLQDLAQILPSSLFILVLTPYALNGTSGDPRWHPSMHSHLSIWKLFSNGSCNECNITPRGDDSIAIFL